MESRRPTALIVGASAGGVAAALGVCEMGGTAVLVCSSDRVGGQLVHQGAPPDEHPWIERTGSTAAYRRFRELVRHHCRSSLPWIKDPPPQFNPGGGWVSALCFAPRFGELALRTMLVPHLSTGRLQLVTASVAELERTADRVGAAILVDADGDSWEVAPDFVLDATDQGDVIDLVGVEHVTGSESSAATGEAHAGAVERPGNLQAFSAVLAVERRAGENHVIDRPADYGYWRQATLPGWPGPLFAWTGADPRTGLDRRYGLRFDSGGAVAGAAAGETVDLWSYRRIVHSAAHPADSGLVDVTLLNWPMNDYAEGNIVGVGADSRAHHVARARSLTLSFLYWLQTEAPHADGVGFVDLAPSPSAAGTPDGFMPELYVREGRRIIAERTVTEQDVTAGERAERGPIPRDDSVGTGAYRIDLHPSTDGDGYIDISTLPFEIPLGALVPVRVDNVLPACKNAGTTHITNGCFRLHPVEWTVGEVAGRLSAFCSARRCRPRDVAHDADERASFQDALDAAGVDRHWPPGVGPL